MKSQRFSISIIVPMIHLLTIDGQTEDHVEVVRNAFLANNLPFEEVGHPVGEGITIALVDSTICTRIQQTLTDAGVPFKHSRTTVEQLNAMMEEAQNGPSD